jgi:hypothetical protein
MGLWLRQFLCTRRAKGSTAGLRNMLYSALDFMEVTNDPLDMKVYVYINRKRAKEYV